MIRNLNNNPAAVAFENDSIILCPEGRSKPSAFDFRTVGHFEELAVVAAWDGFSPEFEHVVTSRIDGVVVPCKVEITGRRIRKFAADLWGVSARVHFADPEAGSVDAIIEHTSRRVQWT